MNKFGFIILVAAIAYYGSHQDQVLGFFSLSEDADTPPTYLDARFAFSYRDADFDFVLVGAMPSAEKCQAEAADYFTHLNKICPNCEKTKAKCTPTLSGRYLKTFDNQPIGIKYVAFELDNIPGRFIPWGVTEQENQQFCDYMLARMQRDRRFSNFGCY